MPLAKQININAFISEQFPTQIAGQTPFRLLHKLNYNHSGQFYRAWSYRIEVENKRFELIPLNRLPTSGSSETKDLVTGQNMVFTSFQHVGGEGSAIMEFLVEANEGDMENLSPEEIVRKQESSSREEATKTLITPTKTALSLVIKGKNLRHDYRYLKVDSQNDGDCEIDVILATYEEPPPIPDPLSE